MRRNKGVILNFLSNLKKLKKLEFSILINVYIIISISLICVYSAKYGETDSFFKKEIVWTFVGTAVFMIISFINYKEYAKYSKIIYMFNIIVLIAVHFLGDTTMGATRWLDFGIIKIQPSEFSKLFMVLTFAELLANGFPNGVRGWKGVVRTGMHFIIPALLILKQPDIGTTLVFIFIYFLLIFLHDVDWGVYIGIIAGGTAMLPIIYKFFLHDYQRKRILTFLNPESDIKGSGWNVIQSIIAIGSGGMHGKGILNGSQNKLNFLPEAHTDFIFSVLLEEMGFVGGVFLILMYAWLLYSIISIGQKCEDTYGQLIAYGIAGIIFFHTIVNMGMVMGIMPVTGIPLLLMSYGGSSYLFMFMMLGVVNSIKINTTTHTR